MCLFLRLLAQLRTLSDSLIVLYSFAFLDRSVSLMKLKKEHPLLISNSYQLEHRCSLASHCQTDFS
jgi:hypothetical protein